MDVVIDVYDRVSGEKVASQTVKRVYTHFSETQSFASAGSLILPDDTIGFAYETEGNRGNAGTGTSATSAFLQVRSKACATNYQPNSAGTACVACPAPSGTKQYRSGDCTVGTCGTGYQANSARTGCVAITCPSGKHLEGDSCVNDVSLRCVPGDNTGGFVCVRNAPAALDIGENEDGTNTPRRLLPYRMICEGEGQWSRDLCNIKCKPSLCWRGGE